MCVDFSIPVPEDLPEYVQEEIDELDEYYRNDDLVQEGTQFWVPSCHKRFVKEVLYGIKSTDFCKDK